MQNDRREGLAGYLGHRITVRGLLDRIRSDEKGSRACIKEPEMDGELICSHIWVMNLTEDWPAVEGQQVSFTALVRRYRDADGENYCLAQPSDLHAVNPPALKIPEPLIPSPVEEEVDPSPEAPAA